MADIQFEKRTIKRVTDTQGKTIVVYPQTIADQVVVTPTEHVKETDVSQALESIAAKVNSATQGGVLKVNGKSPIDGEVTLEPADIGAEAEGAVAAHNIAGDAHADIRELVTAAKGAADKVAEDLATTNAKVTEVETQANLGVTNAATADGKAVAAQEKAEEALSIAKGRAKAVSFETVETMTSTLKKAAKTDYNVGDNLFIKATGVPDYWISGVLDTNAGTYGYFTIAELETQKVDISGLQTKTDDGLSTSDKTVVGAINEVKGTADAAKSTAEANSGTLATVSSDVKTLKDTTVPGIQQDVEALTGRVTATEGVANGADGKANTNAANITKLTNGTTPAGAANKLAAETTITLDGEVTGSVKTDFSTAPTITATIAESAIETSNIANSAVTSAKLADVTELANFGKTGMSVFDVNSKGQVVKTGMLIAFGEKDGVVPASLAVNGLFFEKTV